jgi:type IV secretion system protein TrbB
MSEVTGARPTARQQRISAMTLTAFGALTALIQDPDIVEIMVNPDGQVWYERVGQPMQAWGTLAEQPRLDIVHLVAGAVERECHAHQPRLSAMIAEWGLRFQGFLPPAATAPCFTIRKPALKVFTLADYVRDGILTPAQCDDLIAGIWQRQNLVIAGGTGTGKTTLANAILADMIATGHRIVTIEALQELRCTAPNALALYTVPGRVTTRDLVQDTLLSRPDRIVVGEVKDGSAHDLLKAWNTGHPGGLCTLHADSVEETFERLEDLVAESPDAPPAERIRRMVRRAVQVIVFMERTSEGRTVKEIWHAR